MTYDAAAADRELRHSTFVVVARVLAGEPSKSELLAARNLLREPGRLLPGVGLDRLRLAVDDRLAFLYDVDTADFPGSLLADLG